MELRLPPLTALRAFESVSRLGSVKSAAEELSVSSAAISHHVKTLELFLGIELFRRANRQVFLTTIGQSYALEIRHALQRIVTSTAHVIQNQQVELSLQVAPKFATQYLIPNLNNFHQKYPDIKLWIRADDVDVNFRQETIDAAILACKQQKDLYHSALKTKKQDYYFICQKHRMDETELHHLKMWLRTIITESPSSRKRES